MRQIKALFWKEYRQQILLVAAIFLLGVLLQLSMFASNRFIGKIQSFWTIGMFVTALYAAGASSILFAREHDEKTFGFLRGLPVTGNTVFLGKIAWLLVSTTALAILMGIESGFWVAISDTSDSGASVFGVMGVAVIEALCWGLFWSVRVQSQLTSLLATFASASFASYLMAMIWNQNFSNGNQEIIAAYAGGAPFRLILAVVIGTCAVVQGRKWLYRQTTPPIPKTLTPTQTAAAAKRLLAPPKRGAMQNLLWLSYRQSRPAFVALGAMALVFIAALISIHFLHWNNNVGSHIDMLLLLTLGTVVGLIFCCSTFYRDQQYNAASMLTNIGVAPSKIWWSRIIVFGGAYLLYAIPVGLFVIAFIYATNNVHERVFLSLVNSSTLVYMDNIVPFIVMVTVTILFAVFCFGQMISLFMRSIITGTVVAAVLFLVGGLFWTPIVAYLFGGVGMMWTVLPILFACLIASRIRTADWMRGRNSWAGWRKPVYVLIVPTLVILAAFPFVRVFSVPVIQLGYYGNSIRWSGYGDHLAWSKTLDEHQASLMESYRLMDKEQTFESVRNYLLVEQESTIGVRRSDDINLLDRSVARFVNASHQTPETIKEMIRFLEEYKKTRLTYQERLARQYEIEYRDALYGTMENGEGKTVRKPMLYRYGLFWEKYRIMRRLNYEFQIQSRLADEMDRLINENKGNLRQVFRNDIGHRERRYASYREFAVNVTYLLQGGWNQDFYSRYHHEILFRQQLISLALQAYYLEHGELPETLDVLKGTYLEEIPTIPVTGEPFEYVPHPDAESKTAARAVYAKNSPNERRGVPYLLAPNLRVLLLPGSNDTYRGFGEIVKHLSFVKEKE
jgi:hypothetical protein